jgi:hypothetical protein
MGLLLWGCVSKKENRLLDDYVKNAAYHKRLQKTEKIQLYEANTTKAMLTATYLYTQNQEKQDIRDEVFIVGVYLEDPKQQSAQENLKGLTLNGRAAKKVKMLETNDKRLKKISFVMEWGSYFLVHFPHVEEKEFRLTFKTALYGEGTLHFAKVAKYVLSKQAF